RIAAPLRAKREREDPLHSNGRVRCVSTALSRGVAAHLLSGFSLRLCERAERVMEMALRAASIPQRRAVAAWVGGAFVALRRHADAGEAARAVAEPHDVAARLERGRHRERARAGLDLGRAVAVAVI